MEMKIKNFDELAMNELRRAGLLIAEAGLEAIDTKRAIKERVALNNDVLYVRTTERASLRIGLRKYTRVRVVAIGKASLDACIALEGVMGERLAGGICLDVRPGSLQKIQARVGTHPYPSEENIRATKEIIEFLSGLTEKDFVIFLISGGGSTLLAQPEGMSVQDEERVLKTLFQGGANIKEMNMIRKHISHARGGWLAKHAYPAPSLSLIFSDVPGDDVQVISSGPTIKDATTKEDARKVLKKYKISLPDKAIFETPKEGKYFKEAKHVVFVSNKVALRAMATKAKELGFKPKIRQTAFQGEAREVGKTILKELRKAPPRSALLYGGETTVTVQGKGKGGRNQEVSLGALAGVKNGEFLFSFASDGRDNTDFAGGICDIIVREKAKAANADIEEYLKNNNAYAFYEKVGGYVRTGNTGSNVSDLIIAIK